MFQQGAGWIVPLMKNAVAVGRLTSSCTCGQLLYTYSNHVHHQKEAAAHASRTTAGPRLCCGETLLVSPHLLSSGHLLLSARRCNP